jgi:hypothetical protein
LIAVLAATACQPRCGSRVGCCARTTKCFGARDEDVLDVEWLELCGRENIPVLSKDRRLRYRPAEIEAIRQFGVRAFVLRAGSLTADEQAARFDHSRARIVEASRDTGPALYAVHADRITRIFPPSA